MAQFVRHMAKHSHAIGNGKARLGDGGAFAAQVLVVKDWPVTSGPAKQQLLVADFGCYEKVKVWKPGLPI